jgi:diacylglycerol kinase family enzyme
VNRTPVILNPIAGGGRLLREQERLAAGAAALGSDLDIWVAASPSDTTELARKAAADRLPLVFAYGGDGTYNAVARGLLDSETAMGVLPGGTTSVLAHEFGVPRPVHRAVASLLSGENRIMRVARTDRGEIVLLMLSAGPDSRVLERLRPSFKKLGGRVGVVMQALVEAISGGSLPRIRVASPATMGEVGWVIVGKSRCYGSKYRATPGADPFRDDLEVVAQRSVGRWAAVSFLFGIPWGRHIGRADVARDIVDRVRLEPASEHDVVPFQIDGDVIGTLPVEICIDPRLLRVRLPVRTRPHERRVFEGTHSSEKRSVEI